MAISLLAMLLSCTPVDVSTQAEESTEATPRPVEASAVYKWEWPAHKTRPGWGRSIAQEPRKEMEFIEEYDLRPPWLKY